MCLLLWAEMEQVYSWLCLPYFLSFSDLGSTCDFWHVLSWLGSSEIERTVGGVRCACGRTYGSFVADLEGFVTGRGRSILSLGLPAPPPIRLFSSVDEGENRSNFQLLM
jgi:hypothetical protein